MVLLVLVLAFGALWLYLDSSLTRVPALDDYEGRPADTPGTTWLLVGSDSREGLSEEDREERATGGAAGRRTDTIMVLHIPDGSHPATLISLPRDSYVPIPGHGRRKLNAAFALGGPKLLVQTVETITGLRIDRYAEVGFGGFRDIVDAVGGVEMCIEEPMKDPKAGLDLEAGCQELDGAQALGYVRTRASARADLDRVERQRQFLSALVDKAASPGTLINPFRSIPLLTSIPDALTVGEDEHLHHLAGIGLAMSGGDLVTTTVPISRTGTAPGAGSVVWWDRDKASRLFQALADDQPVPEDVLSGPR